MIDVHAELRTTQEALTIERQHREELARRAAALLLDLERLRSFLASTSSWAELAPYLQRVVERSAVADAFREGELERLQTLRTLAEEFGPSTAERIDQQTKTESPNRN